MLVFVDIDDTICYMPDGAGASLDYARAQPRVSRIQRVNALYDDGHTIVYWTARGTRTGVNWFSTTLSQLEQWGCRFHEVRMGKPVYDLFIDDKNVEADAFFTGDC
jgi:hypothetical protein